VGQASIRAAAGPARMARALDVNPDAGYPAPVVLRIPARPDLATRVRHACTGHYV